MLRVILIGGASHTGKTTLAESLGKMLNWSASSTDSLARHPGRPWPSVRPHVGEHYLKLSQEAIFQFLLVHHANMWPSTRDLISRHVSGSIADALVLEGSALRPEYVAELDILAIEAVWLTASDRLIRDRILRASQFDDASPDHRRMIQRFVDRSLTDNKQIVESAGRLGLRCIDIEQPDLVESFKISCLGRAHQASG